MRGDPSRHLQDTGHLQPLAFGLRQALPALTLSLTAFALVAALAALLSESGVSEAIVLAIIHVGSAVGLLIFWRLGRWGRARFDSFGAALLVLAVAFRLHALIDTLAFGTRFEVIQRYPAIPLPDNNVLLFLKAESIAFAGLLLVVCAWRMRIGLRVEAYSYLLHGKSVPVLTAILAYLAALVVDILIRVLGIGFGALTSFSTTLFMVGVASIYFVAARRASGPGRVTLALAMGLPMMLLALNKGMKSEIFIPLIPAAILFWYAYPRTLVRCMFVALAIFALALSQLYVHHVRQVAWTSDGIARVSPVVLATGFLEKLPTTNPLDALDSISSRVNMTVPRAITVTLADNHGFEPRNVFMPIPATFIPRFLWPDKPVLMPGAQHTARILGLDVPLTEIRSATAAGFMTELYLGGGWLGVIIGGLAFGLLLASAQRWALRRTPGFGHMVFCFLAVYWAFRFDEFQVVYSYTAIVYLVVFLWLLRKVTGAFGLKSSMGIRSEYSMSKRR